jgi:hypothetical protein
VFPLEITKLKIRITSTPATQRSILVPLPLHVRMFGERLKSIEIPGSTNKTKESVPLSPIMTALALQKVTNLLFETLPYAINSAYIGRINSTNSGSLMRSVSKL